MATPSTTPTPPRDDNLLSADSSGLDPSTGLCPLYTTPSVLEMYRQLRQPAAVPGRHWRMTVAAVPASLVMCFHFWAPSAIAIGGASCALTYYRHCESRIQQGSSVSDAVSSYRSFLVGLQWPLVTLAAAPLPGITRQLAQKLTHKGRLKLASYSTRICVPSVGRVLLEQLVFGVGHGVVLAPLTMVVGGIGGLVLWLPMREILKAV